MWPFSPEHVLVHVIEPRGGGVGWGGLLGSKVELATRLKGLIYQKRGARVAFISALNNLSLGIVTSASGGERSLCR